ncbi:unnamed protein product [Heterobilharzia americana]|nr:unnamed protein product [Heterobilharzia americana]
MMTIQHSINQTNSFMFGLTKSHLNLLSRLFFSLLLNFLPTNYTESTSVINIGSCFSKRLDSGNCIGIMEESISQLECCKRGGYYLNRQITQQEYLTDHLLFESGTPNCVQACNEELPSTCKGYVCPEGHYCRMINNEPRCICGLQCNGDDYLTGPLCTTNLRRFRNQCHLKQARCASPKEGLEVIPCPDQGIRCSDSSILVNYKPNYKSILKTFYPDKIPTSSSSSSSSSVSLPSNDQVYTDNEDGIIMMNRRTSKDVKNYILSDNHYFDQSRFEEKTPFSSYTNEITLSKELTCHSNEYCLLRQFDGRPSCEYWSEKSWLTMNHCPESTFHEPMCSTDNQTYYNSCELKLAGLKNQLETRIAYRGECRSKVTCSDITCPREGVSIKRKTQEFGDPVWMTPVQTHGWPVVCGSNGKTYRNTCFLHVVNCLSDKFVELKKPEFCSENIPSILDDWSKHFAKFSSLL